MNKALCGSALVLISACTAAPPKAPDGFGKSLGPCRFIVYQKDGQAVASIDRMGGDGYARGAFGARLSVFVTGSFGQETRTIFAMPHEAEIELTSKNGLLASGGAPGSCEAYDWQANVNEPAHADPAWLRQGAPR